MAGKDASPAVAAGIKTLPASKLDFSVSIAVRDSRDETAVREYAECLADLEPATVFLDPQTGVYRVADGRHTGDAFILKYGEHADVPVDVHDGDYEAALLHALKANVKHGIRETNADKRAKVRVAVKQWPDLSARTIAERCGVSDMFVGTVKRALQSVCNATPPTTVTCSDGREYPATRQSVVRTVPMQPAATRVPEKPASSPVEASIVHDTLDRPIPDHLKEQHAAAAAIQSTASKLDEVRREAEALSKLPGGEFIDDQVIHEIRRAKRAIARTSYYTECPKCRGTVKPKCVRCDGNGYLPHDRDGHIPPDELRWLNGEPYVESTVVFRPEIPFTDQFDSKFGPLVRFMQEAVEHYGIDSDDQKRIRKNLDEVAVAYKQWRQRAAA